MTGSNDSRPNSTHYRNGRDDPWTSVSETLPNIPTSSRRSAGSMSETKLGSLASPQRAVTLLWIALRFILAAESRCRSSSTTQLSTGGDPLRPFVDVDTGFRVTPIRRDRAHRRAAVVLRRTFLCAADSTARTGRQTWRLSRLGSRTLSTVSAGKVSDTTRGSAGNRRVRAGSSPVSRSLCQPQEPPPVPPRIGPFCSGAMYPWIVERESVATLLTMSTVRLTPGMVGVRIAVYGVVLAASGVNRVGWRLGRVWG